MKTVEEARAYLRTFYEQEAVQAHLHAHDGAWTRDQCVKAMDDATDDLIRAVRAEMPCYSGWSHRDCDDGTGYKCPSCKAREDG